MDLLAVTLIANGGRMNKGENRSDLMPNLSVAICAFDLMISDMFFVHELRGIFGIQYFRLTMTLETLPLRDMAISLNNIDMALFTVHPSGNILSMIEIPTFDLNVSFGLDMTGSTTSNGT
jgi:hypothetical protein